MPIIIYWVYAKHPFPPRNNAREVSSLNDIKDEKFSLRLNPDYIHILSRFSRLGKNILTYKKSLLLVRMLKANGIISVVSKF